MKHWFTLFFLCIVVSSFAQVGIGTPTPHPSAQMEITATGKGILIPRMTEAQRPADAAEGLMIYQTDGDKGFYYFNGSAWEKLVPKSQAPVTSAVSVSDATLPVTAGSPYYPPLSLLEVSSDILSDGQKITILKGGVYVITYSFVCGSSVIPSNVTAALEVSGVTYQTSSSIQLINPFQATPFAGALSVPLTAGQTIRLGITPAVPVFGVQITNFNITLTRLN